MLSELIQTNFTSVTILIFFYIFLHTSSTLSKNSLKHFKAMILIVFLLIAGDFAEYLTRGLDHVVTIRGIAAASGYILRPLNVYALMSLAMNYQTRSKAIIGFPLVINTILSLLSLPFGLYFSYTPDNQYVQGPLWIMPFILSGIYMIHITGLAIKKYMSYEKLESGILILAIAVICISVYMEAFAEPPFMGLLNGAGTMALVFYYLFLHTRSYNHDAMTGMLNRRAYYAEVPKLSENHMVVVSADLNNLKKINDVQGHDAGDNAINYTAACLFRILPKFYHIYRMGGDEFVVLCPKADSSFVEEKFRLILADMKNAGYELAWGCSDFNPGDNFKEVSKTADENMYSMKKQMKGSDVR